MEESCKVDRPINLNCWKHHSGFIKSQISSFRNESDLENLERFLLKIGESQMDLYYGRLSPTEIAELIIENLEKKNFLSFESYNQWLSEKDASYKLISLSDNSIWTLRKGNDNARYVHIHPGRYSPHTKRVKALTLKTAIFALCFEKLGGIKLSGIELINHIRKEYLNEPPLRQFSSESGLSKIINLLRA